MKAEDVLKALGRIPVKPLSYKLKNLAVPGEIMVDYDDDLGHLYQKGLTGDIIIDLDRNIGEIDETTANDVKVTIDGVTTSLYELLYVMKSQLNSTVHAEIKDTEVVYTERKYAYDSNSIETNMDNVQVKGFGSAQNSTIPMKIDGKIVWVSVTDLVGNTGSTPSNPGASDPTDGIFATVAEIIPLNDKIYLLASKKQFSKNLTKNYKVILPNTIDGYSEINYCLTTNSFAPKLEFSDKVIWKVKDDNQPGYNTVNVYVFKTWDNGFTWYAELTRYNQEKKGEE